MSHRVKCSVASESGNPKNMSRLERKKQEREEKKKSWFDKIKERGGFKQKKARCYGAECTISQCPKWGDGLCQYPERDIEQCFMELKKVEKQLGKKE